MICGHGVGSAPAMTFAHSSHDKASTAARQLSAAFESRCALPASTDARKRVAHALMSFDATQCSSLDLRRSEPVQHWKFFRQMTLARASKNANASPSSAAGWQAPNGTKPKNTSTPTNPRRLTPRTVAPAHAATQPVTSRPSRGPVVVQVADAVRRGLEAVGWKRCVRVGAPRLWPWAFGGQAGTERHADIERTGCAGAFDRTERHDDAERRAHGAKT